jgi:hypothetical protein
MHIHTGIVMGFSMYLWWVFFHALVQMIALQLHSTRFGQALALFG